ncbi:MAG: tyrosine-type recombinase/integrase [Gemmatimonadota bacterium]|nr:tyrosine-type recombinase/integrase [Gemmatimonadota bacterium]
MTTTAPIATAALPAATALSSAARSLAGASLAPSTVRAYGRLVAALEAWLAARGRVRDDAAVADWIADLHQIGQSPATIGQAVAAIRFASRVSGQPDIAGPATARVLAGIRREGRGRGPGQVQGIGWPGADAIAALAAASRSPAGLRDAAMVALASDCLLRVSELVAVDVADIAREDDGSGRLTVRHSKADQEGRGQALYAGPGTMARIAAWCDCAGIGSGPVFVRILRGGHPRPGARITARAARQVIASRAAAAGIPGRVSGHSLRVGAAQSLAAAGAGLVELQQAGRWGSPSMPGHYARGQLAARGAVARLRHGQ